jgi:hypothetical protein
MWASLRLWAGGGRHQPPHPTLPRQILKNQSILIGMKVVEEVVDNSAMSDYNDIQILRDWLSS